MDAPYYIRRRVSYKRYKDVLEAAMNSTEEERPEKVLEAAFFLVENYRGHQKSHIARSAYNTICYLKDEYVLEQAEKKGELPLLIGYKWTHQEHQNRFEQLIKKDRKHEKQKR